MHSFSKVWAWLAAIYQKYLANMPESVGRAQVITDRLQEVLDEVDLNLTSQRQITNKLAEELGDDVYEYKALIKVPDSEFS